MSNRPSLTGLLRESNDKIYTHGREKGPRLKESGDTPLNLLVM